MKTFNHYNQIKSTAEAFLKKEVVKSDPIGGGKNSRVFRIFCSNEDYILKCYFQSPVDRRNRLKTEFDSLEFLWKNGIRCIPQPLYQNTKLNFAIYEFIHGTRITSDEIQSKEIDEAIQFLLSLKNLAVNKDTSLPIASEACFSIQELIESLHSRFRRLSSTKKEGEIFLRLHNFLSLEFLHSFEEIEKWSLTKLKQKGIKSLQEISADNITLSPSDFGFHNAICRKNKIVFLDFEYFGWDDPAKMISDFLLHPAMLLKEPLKKHFVGQIISLFGQENLSSRLEVVYPFFGLKWCLILLNEFLIDELERRNFAFIEQKPLFLIQEEQLAKSKNMLERIKNTYERFPYY